MGAKKFPVLDEDFLDKCLEACDSDEEKGLFLTYWYTGMRASEPTELTRNSLKSDGHVWWIVWTDQSTGKLLNARIPDEKHVEIVAKFLDMKRKTRIWYHFLIRDIGERAGYENISPESLRKTYCVKLLREGHTSAEIQRRMRCSSEVVAVCEGALNLSQTMKRGEAQTHEDRLNMVPPAAVTPTNNSKSRKTEKRRTAPSSLPSGSRSTGRPRKKGAPKENVIKQRFLQLYGSKCACCGEAIEAFLTLDHIHDDGKDHRAMFKGASQRVMQDAVDNPDFNRYQILCWNCQMAKRYHEICPHKMKRDRLSK